MDINIFLQKLTVSRGNPLQIGQNQEKSQRNYTVMCVVARVVTRSSYGNALHYGLSMFVDFQKLSYPSVISISVRFHKPSLLLLSNLLNK